MEFNDLESNRKTRIDEREKQENELQKSLDRYSLTMIKTIGLVGAMMGIVILGIIWYWILMKLLNF